MEFALSRKQLAKKKAEQEAAKAGGTASGQSAGSSLPGTVPTTTTGDDLGPDERLLDFSTGSSPSPPVTLRPPAPLPPTLPPLPETGSGSVQPVPPPPVADFGKPSFGAPSAPTLPGVPGGPPAPADDGGVTAPEPVKSAATLLNEQGGAVAKVLLKRYAGFLIFILIAVLLALFLPSVRHTDSGSSGLGPAVPGVTLTTAVPVAPAGGGAGAVVTVRGGGGIVSVSTPAGLLTV
jgi:hypothetical protein